MRFGTITRGKGKLYIALDVEVPEGAKIEAFSRTDAGTLLPTSVLCRSEEQYVLVLPSLTVDQRVILCVLDGNDNVLESMEQKIGHAQAALSSKMNTLRKAPDLADLRNCDDMPVCDEAWMRIDRFVNFEDGTELIHGYVMVPCPDPAIEADLHLVIMDRRGCVVESPSTTIIADKIARGALGSESLMRIIEVSIRKPYELDAFVIWMHFDGESYPDGFLGVEAHEVEGYRSIFGSQINESGQSGVYNDWFRLREKTPEPLLAAQRASRFDIEPTFSIVVPLFETPLEYFHDMVKSVRDQTYGNWELILVNASPESAGLSSAVSQYTAADERIHEIRLEGNRGITLNTNEGIKVAKGDFISFFDHDDLLEPDILFEYVKAINAYPQTDLLYCDEDKYADGRYFDGLFKPDFDWDMITSVNYVAHMLTVRKVLIDKLDGLPGKQFDGAQDHNLTILIAEQARNIYHVRKVLYHWRSHEKSTATHAEAKPWTSQAGRLAVAGHFERMGIKVHVKNHAIVPNYYDVIYELPAQPPLVSIIIPNKDSIDLLDRCIRSIFDKTSYANYEVVIVENNSEEQKTFDYYDSLSNKYENIKVITYEGAFNFSAICNRGARYAAGDLLLFLNNDTEVITPDWLEAMVGPTLREDVGCVGAKLLFPDDTIQHAGVIFPDRDADHICRFLPRNSLFWFGFLQITKEYYAVTGACMLVKRSIFDSVSGFDESFAVAYNDIDLCLRIREAGYCVVMQPRAELYHYESSTRGHDLIDASKRARLMSESGKMRERWNAIYGKGDVFYSPRFKDFSIYCQLEWRDYRWGLI